MALCATVSSRLHAALMLPNLEGRIPGMITSKENRDPKHRTAAAERALAEASARRSERDSARPQRPKEISGRDGLEPTRYGDWEVKGIASDF
jgi:hypothetical protein